MSPAWCRRGESLARVGWRDALKAIRNDGWELCGNHLVLDGFTYYYMTERSVALLTEALAKEKGGA